MIRNSLYIARADWQLVVYYAVDGYDIDRVVDEMLYVGCTRIDIERAISMMEADAYNEGWTCSNLRNRCSVMVIGKTTTTEEFANTLAHEQGHLMRHISQSLGINPYGEDEQYILGEIVSKMFPIAKKFLCEHCRQNIRKNR